MLSSRGPIPGKTFTAAPRFTASHQGLKLPCSQADDLDAVILVVVVAHPLRCERRPMLPPLLQSLEPSTLHSSR